MVKGRNTTVVHSRVPDFLFNSLEHISNKEKVPISGIIRSAINEYVRSYETASKSNRQMMKEAIIADKPYPQDIPDRNIPGTKPIITIKVGRNDPCPCGSGRKYKHCCGKSL